MSIETIMLFAAGRGTRMQPMTDQIPKPLVQINGRPILHWILDRVLTYPFKKIIINTHHLAEQIVESVADYCKNLPQQTILPKIIFSSQDMLLGNGGGLKNNLHYCEDIVFASNSDTILYSQNNIFTQMLTAWNPEKMDMLLLLHPTQQTIGYTGKGDFLRDSNGYVYRDEAANHMPYMNTGIYLIKTNIVAAWPKKIFLLSEYFFAPKYKQRIYSVVNNGHWCHATSPQDVIDIENYIKQHRL